MLLSFHDECKNKNHRNKKEYVTEPSCNVSADPMRWKQFDILIYMS